jgi:hypothetical protein
VRFERLDELRESFFGVFSFVGVGVGGGGDNNISKSDCNNMFFLKGLPFVMPL